MMVSTILYCFYDLSVCPSSYDFFDFMQTAELHRKRYELEEIYFIFVPGSKGGWVTVKDAVKKPFPEDAILPAALKSAADEAAKAAEEAAAAAAAEAEAEAARLAEEQAATEAAALAEAEASIESDKKEGDE